MRGREAAAAAARDPFNACFGRSKHRMMVSRPFVIRRRLGSSSQGPPLEPLGGSSPQLEPASPPLAGHATREGTAAFFQKHSIADALSCFNPRTNLSLSRFGFGCRCISPLITTHQTALDNATLIGCNVIDTAPVFSEGLSEVLVGQILRKQVDKKLIKREQMVVITKVGRISEQMEQKRKSRLTSYSNEGAVIPLSSGFGYSLAPEVLEDQVTASLERLGLEQIDFLMVHNPEGLLGAQPHLRPAFYDSMAKAFAHLEKEVKRGRIQYYGVSSSAFAASSPNHVSLTKLVQAANDVSERNSFAAVQFPFNLIEAEALTEGYANVAKEHNLLRFSYRAIDATLGGHLHRLVSYPDAGDGLVEKFRELCDTAINLETCYPGRDDPTLPDASNYSWAQILVSKPELRSSIYSWINHLEWTILPNYERAIIELENHPTLKAWGDRYKKAMRDFFDSLTLVCQANASRSSKRLTQAAKEAWPALQDFPLVEQALKLSLSSGVADCVLVGMRRPSYVRQTLFRAVTQMPPAECANDCLKYAQFRGQVSAHQS